ncbi:alanine racemase [Litorihabitans aurantiacus]|uniref:Alanine racemase N-terminal domain-containing protein n=1 Tax=Litorihabitans aurantiacus TaxID=1930061 RepID=A0AA38CUG2_9MICO|nr:alanine racemase [Litorihabitans aurantiacus]GMA32110.1 hypothetical protein GCM10025875_21020 [Litorihabitans aurantiacus]
MSATGGSTVGPHHKSFPASLWGTRVDDVGTAGLHLGDLATPLLTLDAGALAHNTARMAAWAAGAGVELAPHGKTSMAPALWQMMLDAGAWGVTVATGWQAQVALTLGVPRVLVANEVTDPALLRWLAGAERDRVRLWCDSTAAVRAAHDACAAVGGSLDVLVDLGGDGGRTGARTREVAIAVADAVLASPTCDWPAPAGTRVRWPATAPPPRSNACAPGAASCARCTTSWWRGWSTRSRSSPPRAARSSTSWRRSWAEPPPSTPGPSSCCARAPRRCTTTVTTARSRP